MNLIELNYSIGGNTGEISFRQMYATNERTTGKLLIRDQIAATRLRGLRVNLLKIDA